MKKIKAKLILIYIGVFLVFALGSFGVFKLVNGLSQESSLSGDKLNDVRSKIVSAPKTEECPLNGAMHTEIERDIWKKRRPMGIMIENHPDARPLSGLSKADVVYEAVAEGGVTRFLGVYYCDASAQNVSVSPIRSSRVYFIDWISEYGDHPLYVHFGGANNYCNYDVDKENCMEDYTKQPGKVDPKVMAIEKLVDMGWRHSKGNALDGGTNAGAPAIVRDQYRLSDDPSAWEHSPLGSTDLLFDMGAKNGFAGRGWDKNFVSWKFKDASPLSSSKVNQVEFEFWPNKPDFEVSWDYDSSNNSYLRSNGGVPQTDWEFDKPRVSAMNVVIMFIEEESSVDEEGHLYYHTIGSGDALIFQNGDVVEGTWNKDSQYDRTIFTDKTGNEIEFVRGKIWIETVPEGNEVIYN